MTNMTVMAVYGKTLKNDNDNERLCVMESY